MPRVQTCFSFYRSANDVIVHLHWNALHKRGRKQSGDADWSIIIKPHPSSTQEAWLRLQSIHNVMSYLTILILQSLSNATPRHCHWSLINLTGSLYEEAQSDEVSKCKSPWQQRRLCKHMTLSPRVLKASVLYYKVKKIFTTCTVTRVIHGKGYNNEVRLKDDKSINFTKINLMKILE